MQRLNLGCGLAVTDGWVNVDREDHGQLVQHRFDFRPFLPFDTASFDCVVAHHVLDTLTLDELAKVLSEIHRVLIPGGVLRISTPDVAIAIHHCFSGDLAWFSMVERGATVLEKLSHWLTWYGTRRTLLCQDMVDPMLRAAGFQGVAAVQCGESFYDLRGAVCALDSREDESLFIEALA